MTKRPPGPRGLPILGGGAAFIRDRLGYLAKVAAHGPVTRMKILWETYYIIREPELIQQTLAQGHTKMQKDRFTHELSRVLGWGLVSSEGDLWRRQRKLVSHAFTPKRIKTYGDAMAAAGARTLADWKDGQEIDASAAMSELTLDVVGKTLFDADVRGTAKEVGEALYVISDFYVESLETLIPTPAWWPGRENRRFQKAVLSVDKIITDIVAERRGSGEDRGDLLSALLHAKDEQGAMSDQQLRDELVTLFLAGHETTSLALTYAFYFLSQNREMEQKAHEEAVRVLGDRPANADDVERLDYIGRVIKEAMRLYPPVWTIGRELLEDIELAGYTLEKGSTLLFSQWVTHRLPEYFPEPERFDPDRWLPERAEGIHKFAYFPFGGGPRICIGNHFAIMEAVLLLATLIRKYRLELLPNQELEFHPSVTLRMKKGLRMRLHAREKAPARAA